jgi:hypothetical protein
MKVTVQLQNGDGRTYQQVDRVSELRDARTDGPCAHGVLVRP